MKPVSTIFALATCFLPFHAFSGEILPFLYARKYCEMRQIGVKNEDAIRMAIETAFISNSSSFDVSWNGKNYRADILNAVTESERLCPNLFKTGLN